MHLTKFLEVFTGYPLSVSDAGGILGNRPSGSLTENKQTVYNVTKEEIPANY